MKYRCQFWLVRDPHDEADPGLLCTTSEEAASAMTDYLEQVGVEAEMTRVEVEFATRRAAIADAYNQTLTFTTLKGATQ